jgi:hypothetical protein
MSMSLRSRAAAVFAVCSLYVTAFAAPVLTSGQYVLRNHPDGELAPPRYGLRLDQLDGNSSSRYTFDFDDSRSRMLMDLDLNTGIIRIHGTAWGGQDVGGAYASTSSGRVGLWQIDFTYKANVTTRPDGTILVSRPNPQQNKGWIQPLFSSNVSRFRNSPKIPLVDYASNSNSPSFLLQTGYRGFSGVSGAGWMRHSNNSYYCNASDWLFTIHQPVTPPPPPPPIPSPTALSLGMLGLAGVSGLRRRMF